MFPILQNYDLLVLFIVVNYDIPTLTSIIDDNGQEMFPNGNIIKYFLHHNINGYCSCRLWYNKSNTYIIQKSGWGHDKAQINTTEKQKDILDLLTTFNINARYPDFKMDFYNKCNYNFTTKNIELIKEMRL